MTFGFIEFYVEISIAAFANDGSSCLNYIRFFAHQLIFHLLVGGRADPLFGQSAHRHISETILAYLLSCSSAVRSELLCDLLCSVQTALVIQRVRTYMRRELRRGAR